MAGVSGSVTTGFSSKSTTKHRPSWSFASLTVARHIARPSDQVVLETLVRGFDTHGRDSFCRSETRPRQERLYFRPEPPGQGSFRPARGPRQEDPLPSIQPGEQSEEVLAPVVPGLAQKPELIHREVEGGLGTGR